MFLPILTVILYIVPSTLISVNGYRSAILFVDDFWSRNRTANQSWSIFQHVLFYPLRNRNQLVKCFWCCLTQVPVKNINQSDQLANYSFNIIKQKRFFSEPVQQQTIKLENVQVIHIIKIKSLSHIEDSLQDIICGLLRIVSLRRNIITKQTSSRFS